MANEYVFSTLGTRRELKASEKRRGMGKVDWGDSFVGGMQNGFEERLEATGGYVVWAYESFHQIDRSGRVKEGLSQRKPRKLDMEEGVWGSKPERVGKCWFHQEK